VNYRSHFDLFGANLLYVMIDVGKVWTVTHWVSSTMTRHVYLINRYQLSPRPVVAVLPTRGSTRNAAKPNGYLGRKNVSLGVLGRCLTLARQLYRHGDFNVDNTPVCCVTKTSFWTARVNADQQHPPRLWQSFDQLLGRGCAPSTDISAPVLHKFFDDKIASVRTATDDAPKPMFTTAPPGCEFRLFTPVTATDGILMVRAFPDKQCSCDPLPTWLLKASTGLLAPFLCHLFNWSFEHGEVPSSMKATYITPIVKKSDMDPMEAKSYRPISNLVQASRKTGQ